MELSAQARVLVFLWCGRVFSLRRKIVAAPYISFSLIIVKSLQLREYRQISQPRKYCLVRMIVFFYVCFLYLLLLFFLFLTGWEFELIPYNWYQSLGLGLSGSNGRGSRKGVWNRKEKTTTDLMKALSGMYEKSSTNNKVHLMKRLFNLKMVENASVAQHLNEFKTITNQLLSAEIDFDDEIRALIVLAFLPNSWEAMRMAVSNSTGKEKLKYNDIRDLILAKEFRRRDTGETSGFDSTLNLGTRGRCNDRNSNWGRSKSRNSNRNRNKSRSGQQVQCWNCGKTGHFRRQCKSPKKKNKDDYANTVTEEVYDALLLAVDSPLDD